jgi:DnaJ-class molecular chaperone
VAFPSDDRRRRGIPIRHDGTLPRREVRVICGTCYGSGLILEEKLGLMADGMGGSGNVRTRCPHCNGDGGWFANTGPGVPADLRY